MITIDILDRSYAKKLLNGLSSGYSSSSVTDNADGSKTLTINFVNGDKAEVTFSPVKGDKGDTGTSVQDVKIQEISGVRHLIVTLDDGTEIDAGVLPNEQYDDTAIKQDISDLQSDKQDKADNTLDTTDKTVTGAINEIYGTQLDTVGFSADYKNIILNRKSGLNPYTIPISSIIHNAKLTELNDIDSTDIGNGKTLVYDSATQKHKYVDSTGTDELVKMEASTEAHYLSDLIDKSTIVNDNGTLKVKKLDGQEVTITEINYLKGLTMNVMDLVNMFSNGGVKIINTPVATYADLLVYDKSALIEGISYLIYVLADETHDNVKTTYLIDKDTTTPTYFGFAGEHRDFTTNPIDLANEVTGKLGASNIDVDALWKLLTINDTYKTLTTNNEVFGTHGAKALYDELVTAIGDKANSNDLTTHTGDTDIHVTTTDKTKWDKVTDKANSTDLTTHTGDTDIHTSATEKASYVKKTDITNTINSTSTDTQVPSAKSVWGSLYKICDTQILVDANKPTSKICMADLTTLNTPSKEGLTTAESSLIISIENRDYWNGQISITMASPEVYVRSVRNAGTWTKWRKLCITSVKDVAKTNITPSDETIFIGFKNNEGSNYYVQNGICYVTLWNVKISQTGNTIRTGLTLPVPKGTRAGTLMTGNGDATPHAFAYVAPSGELNFDVKDANVMLYGSFSYLVAES